MFEDYYSKVLLLNQSYEPLTVCDVRKAFILMYLGKAELVEKIEGKNLRSVQDIFPFPTVIRLNNYCHVPYRDVILSRKNIIRRDKHTCAYCGTKNVQMTVDHIVPKAKGGRDSWDNLITACHKCNNKKGNSTPSEANMKMKFRAFKPNHLMFIKSSVGGTVHRSWKPFLYNT